MLTQVRTAFCDSCMEITVQSNGGAQEHQPNRFSTLFKNKHVNSNLSDTQIKGNGDQPNRFQTLLRTKNQVNFIK